MILCQLLEMQQHERSTLGPASPPEVSNFLFTVFQILKEQKKNLEIMRQSLYQQNRLLHWCHTKIDSQDQLISDPIFNHNDDLKVENEPTKSTTRSPKTSTTKSTKSTGSMARSARVDSDVILCLPPNKRKLREEVITIQEDDSTSSSSSVTAAVTIKQEQPKKIKITNLPDVSTIENPHNTQRFNSSSCHQCKTRRSDLVLCNTNKQQQAGKKSRRVCVKKYCTRCLFRYYQEVAQDDNYWLGKWICPACRDLCSCATCRRRPEEGAVSPVTPVQSPKILQELLNKNNSSNS